MIVVVDADDLTLKGHGRERTLKGRRESPHTLGSRKMTGQGRPFRVRALP